MGSVLLVAGEASGDDFASGVLPHLKVPVWGVGGPRSVEAGLASLAPLPSVMGLSSVATKAPKLWRLRSLLLERVRHRVPSAALLVGFSDFNEHLSRALERQSIPVVSYAPPQVWAWRPWRAQRIANHTTRLATLFDFEVEVWSRAGGRAHHVGHPAGLIDPARRATLRSAYGMERDTALLLLPGSREREIVRHAPVLVRAGALLLERRVVSRVALALAASLPTRLATDVRLLCRGSGIELLNGPATAMLPAFDVAGCCSGTATLECAAAGVPPVIVYDAGALTGIAARHFLRVKHVGLPNLLLDRRAFPELLGPCVQPESVCRAVQSLLGSRGIVERDCQAVREHLTPRSRSESTGSTPGERVAHLLEPWLA